jgi:hypothetical protein
MKVKLNKEIDYEFIDKIGFVYEMMEEKNLSPIEVVGIIMGVETDLSGGALTFTDKVLDLVREVLDEITNYGNKTV